jgi:hypothetical protein
MTKLRKIIVAPKYDGMRLDHLMIKLFPRFNARDWKAYLRLEKVTLSPDFKSGKKEAPVLLGHDFVSSRLEIFLEGYPPTAGIPGNEGNNDLNFIAQQKGLVVLNKAPGTRFLEEGEGLSLKQLLNNKSGQRFRKMKAVNELGTNTSGVAIFAEKDIKTFAKWNTWFSDSLKTYWVDIRSEIELKDLENVLNDSKVRVGLKIEAVCSRFTLLEMTAKGIDEKWLERVFSKSKIEANWFHLLKVQNGKQMFEAKVPQRYAESLKTNI